MPRNGVDEPNEVAFNSARPSYAEGSVAANKLGDNEQGDDYEKHARENLGSQCPDGMDKSRPLASVRDFTANSRLETGAITTWHSKSRR
ncbi:MAG: hypothetical protein R3D67_07560, partial [Hyphomicrobiaceae bacterium]